MQKMRRDSRRKPGVSMKTYSKDKIISGTIMPQGHAENVERDKFRTEQKSELKKVSSNKPEIALSNPKGDSS